LWAGHSVGPNSQADLITAHRVKVTPILIEEGEVSIPKTAVTAVATAELRKEKLMEKQEKLILRKTHHDAMLKAAKNAVVGYFESSCQETIAP
jgi:hypothetical protein